MAPGIPPIAKKLTLAPVSVLALAAALVYVQAPWSELFWDDYFVARDQVAHFASLRSILFPPQNIPGLSPYYYRPVVWLSQALDARLFGAGARAGPHVVNVAVHVLTTLLFWRLALKMFQGRSAGPAAAMISALLFAVHPVHAESVIWLSGRSDLLAALFFVACLLAALRWRDRGSPSALALAGVLFILGLFAKETAAAGVVIVPAALLLADRPSAAGAPARPSSLAPGLAAAGAAALLLMLAVGYFWLRQRAGMSQQYPLKVLDAQALWEPLRATAWYLVKVFAPWPQSAFVGADLLPGRVATMLVLLLAAALLAMAARLARRDCDGVPLLGIGWFCATLAPALAISLLSLFESPVSERYLYLPSAGAALGIGALYCRVAGTRWAGPAAWLLAALGLAYAASALERGSVWRTELGIWQDAAGRNAAYGFPWNMLGIAHGLRGQQEPALQAFLRARELRNRPAGQANINVNIGKVYNQRRQPERAIEYFTAAVQADPGFAAARAVLGKAWFDLARQTTDPALREQHLLRSVRHQREALAIDAASIESRVELGRALAGLAGTQETAGRLREAIGNYRAAMRELDAALAAAVSDVQRTEIILVQREARAALQRL